MASQHQLKQSQQRAAASAPSSHSDHAFTVDIMRLLYFISNVKSCQHRHAFMQLKCTQAALIESVKWLYDGLILTVKTLFVEDFSQEIAMMIASF